MWQWKENSSTCKLFVNGKLVVTLELIGDGFVVIPETIYSSLVDSSKEQKLPRHSVSVAKKIIAERIRNALVRHTNAISEGVLK